MSKVLVRHVMGAAASAAAGYLTSASGMPVDDTALMGLMIAVYAVVEKALKKVTDEA